MVISNGPIVFMDRQLEVVGGGMLLVSKDPSFQEFKDTASHLNIDHFGPYHPSIFGTYTRKGRKAHDGCTDIEDELFLVKTIVQLRKVQEMMPEIGLALELGLVHLYQDGIKNTQNKMSFINYAYHGGSPYLIHSTEFDNHSLSVYLSSSFNPLVDDKHAYISEVYKYCDNLISHRVTAVVHTVGFHDHYVHAEFGGVGRATMSAAT